MSVAPRAVVVSRPTEYVELLGRHGTRQQAQFFLDQRGQDVRELDRRHQVQEAALAAVAAAIPGEWRRSSVLRQDLDRWLFEPEDVVITVGQDGLIANVAKYLTGQPVIGVNPDYDRQPGVLARFAPTEIADALRTLERGGGGLLMEERALVEACTDDGQCVVALNEVFVGSATHQSARYSLTVPDGQHESQSSSGVIVGTGTGATGWCLSLWNDRQPPWPLPEATSRGLAWFVREAWPSQWTGAELTGGRVEDGYVLRLTASSDSLVVFGDGIEHDRLDLTWGQDVTIRLATQHLNLAVGASLSGSRRKDHSS